MSYLRKLIADKRAGVEREATAPNFNDFLSIHPELQKDSCICGRMLSLTKLHCPDCGRAPLYPMATKIEAILPDGTSVMATKFRCRGCPRVYTDVEVYFNCKALPPKEKASVIQGREKLMNFTGGLDAQGLVKQLIALRESKGNNVDDLKQRLEEMKAKPGTPEYYEENPEES